MEQAPGTHEQGSSRTPVSVFIVTLNEAAHIAETLDSVRDLDDIVVVDSGSSDGTVDIARQRGARVLHQKWLGFARQKAFALEQCRNEWCLNLDGDEFMPPALLEEVRALIESDRCDVLRLRIEDLFMGAPMHPWSRKRTIARCFRKSKVRYPDDRRVHENIQSEGRVVTTKNSLIHHGYDDARTFMNKYSGYAWLKAADKYDRGQHASAVKLFLVFPFSFLKVYLFRRLILSGQRGLIQSCIEAMYAFLKEAYLYQMHRTHRAGKSRD